MTPSSSQWVACSVIALVGPVVIDYLKRMSSSLPESRTEVTIVFESLRFVESLVIRADDDKKVGFVWVFCKIRKHLFVYFLHTDIVSLLGIYAVSIGSSARVFLVGARDGRILETEAECRESGFDRLRITWPRPRYTYEDRTSVSCSF